MADITLNVPDSIANFVELNTFLKNFKQAIQISTDVAPWEIIFTRKVAATTASDLDYIDSGIVYNSAYEYCFIAKNFAAPTSDPSSQASLVTAFFGGADGAKANYKPDGATSMSFTGSTVLYVPINMDMSALVSAYASVGAGGITVNGRVDSSGHFWTKWTQDMANDGHFAIARRKRYG